MKKILLILISYLIAGTSLIEAKDFYLTGSFNGWQPNQSAYKFSESNGVYTLFLNSISGDLKITTSAWEEQYGCNSKISYGTDFDVVQSGDGYNIILPEDPAKGVTITFNYNTKKIRFDKTPALYLVGDFNNWTLLPAYQFSYRDGLFVLNAPSFYGNFKVLLADNNQSFGSGTEIKTSVETQMVLNGGNMKFNGNGSKKSRIIITVNPNALTSEQPEEKPSDEVDPGKDETPETPDIETPEEQTPEEKPGNNPPEEEPDNSAEVDQQPALPDDTNGDDTPSQDPVIDNPGGEEPGNEPLPDDTPNDYGEIDNPETPSDSTEEDNSPDVPEDNNSDGDSDDDNGNEAPDSNEGEENNPSDPGDISPDEGEDNPSDPETPDDPEGISSIFSDNETPVYYNLSGFRVEHPSGGLFIKREAGKSVKVFIP